MDLEEHLYDSEHPVVKQDVKESVKKKNAIRFACWQSIDDPKADFDDLHGYESNKGVVVYAISEISEKFGLGEPREVHSFPFDKVHWLPYTSMEPGVKTSTFLDSPETELRENLKEVGVRETEEPAEVIQAILSTPLKPVKPDKPYIAIDEYGMEGQPDPAVEAGIIDLERMEYGGGHYFNFYHSGDPIAQRQVWESLS